MAERIAPCLTPFFMVKTELTLLDIGKLLGVYEDEEAEVNDRGALPCVIAVHHLHEHLGVHGDIKGAGHVHDAGKDLAAVAEEVVNGGKHL